VSFFTANEKATFTLKSYLAIRILSKSCYYQPSLQWDNLKLKFMRLLQGAFMRVFQGSIYLGSRGRRGRSGRSGGGGGRSSTNREK